MRAVQMPAPRMMEFVELPDPTIGPGQVLVRLTEVALCGSDLVTYLATIPREFPAQVGKPAHECVGVVVESQLDGYAPGDRVLYFPPGQDALREYAVAETPDQLLKLPDYGDISEWMMAQLLGTVFHAVRKLGCVINDRIAVIGQGPVGQLFNHLMWNMGAQTIIGIDVIPERLAVSPKMHATHTLLAGSDDVHAGVRGLTDGLGADLVIEASGFDETLAMMIELVRRHGRILMFGSPKHLTAELPIKQVFSKRLDIFTTAGPDVEKDIHMALRYIESGRIDVTPILTHRFPFEQVHEAYEVYAERQRGCVKVIVEIAPAGAGAA